MWRDISVIIAGQEEHIAVLDEKIGLFDVDSERQIDERIISDQDIVLQIKRPQSGHIGVSVVFGEVVHGKTGLQGGCFLENGL